MFVLGGVRGMTGETPFLIGHRGMFERNLLALLFMAINAEVIRPFLFEFRVFGSMRVVAGQTFTFFKWVMFYRSATFQLRSIMAIITELTSCFVGAKRLWVRG